MCCIFQNKHIPLHRDQKQAQCTGHINILKVEIMRTENIYRVEDTETGNYCIYEGSSIQDAFEAIKDNAAIDNGEPFEDAELFDLYDGEERIWCGKTDTIEALCDICFENPVFGKTVRNYMSAMFCWGSDPTLVEDIDTAISIFLMTNKDSVIVRPLRKAEDLADAWEKLDLTDEQPTKVYTCGEYNQENWLICFYEDYI